jgi:colicin import membrane protein
MRYDVVVVGSLERAKQFPKQASRRRARGTAVVGFALDETGRVLVAALLRSSGDRDLDNESLAVIARAAPFPKPPPGVRRKFAVDIAFGMGG